MRQRSYHASRGQGGLGGSLPPRPRIVILVAFCLTSQIGKAHAQPPETPASAETAHRSGVDAFAAGDLEVARASFEQALELSPRPSTAFNLALVLRMQGKPGRARTLVGRALTEEFGELAERERGELDRLVRELSQEVGELAVRGYGAETIVFRLDDETSWTATEGEQRNLFVEPGSYRITAEAEGRTPVQSNVGVDAGRLRVVSLRLLAPNATNITDATSDERDESESPWPLVLGVGGGVIALATAIIVIVLLTNSSEPEPDLVIPL